MNARIKELCKQAMGKNWRYDFDEEIAERFAELIVQECMNTIAESREARQTSYYYRNRVAEHFGVEQ